MNFFGHAAVASAHFTEYEPALAAEHLPELCAGSMLPDFVAILRIRPPVVHHAAVRHGVAFHHGTDEAFHDLPGFLRLSREAFAWLSAHALPRGPARAVAHIGIEILLDEILAQDVRARAAYQAALEVPLGQLAELSGSHDATRLAELQAALLTRAQRYVEPTPAQVAERLRRTLASRPRLATDDAGQALLGTWVELTRPQVAAEAPEVLATLRARLAPLGLDE